MAMENYPLLAGILAFGFFVGFAYKTPIYSKLYKELGYSMVLGGTVGYGYAHYYKLKYLAVVDESYDIVKKRFEKNPELIDKVDHDSSPHHIKNFGLS